MLYFILLALFLSLNLTLPLMFSPISLGVWIFILAMTTAGFIGLYSSTWFGLILFIIYIGEYLLYFPMFVAVAPNQMINFFSTLILTLSIFTISIIFLFDSNSLLFHNTPLSETPNMFAFSFLYSSSQAPMLLFLAILLLLALIFVVKIATRKNGPLRPFKT
uniref:NADH dehydrogenase subunit 6 n=1 Tax=Pista cristata TaxID=279652 RepID=B3TJZ7_9ANNE|nr:NADH dehydrogenase subunit 6 [Pista cristata]